jgi:hypothetical protein
MPRRRVPLIADVAYHVYNRGNNRQALFFEPRDYAEFIAESATLFWAIVRTESGPSNAALAHPSSRIA